MSSHIAEVITLIKNSLGSSIGGISPHPVPPQAVFPYITVTEIHGSELESLTGISGQNRMIVQVDCWDKSHEVAWGIRVRVKALLLPYKGTAGTQTVAAVNHQNDAALYDGNRSLHQLVTRLFIWWTA